LHLKVFSVLLGITFFVECCAIWLIDHHISNIPMYNIFMLVEFWVYAWYYRLILKSKTPRKIINIFLWIYPLFWAIVVFWVFGINRWNSYLSVIGSFFTILFSVAYYYQLFTQPELARLDRTPEFWIATGLLLFYTCELPFMGTLNFLVKNYRHLAHQLITVLQVLDILMYSIFIYAFLCRTIIKK